MGMEKDRNKENRLILENRYMGFLRVKIKNK